ncbi:ANX13-like protein [Mya arenaria]|uniref:Annexin n=1 Tax=Mya arenaria TaxID=6604 RepID=A0ABY7FEP5_MYAAR|nr:ANX13-like protein [Mya arenaria]
MQVPSSYIQHMCTEKRFKAVKMPRHGPGLGANNFPAANKLLMRYEADRSYKIHQQKLANVKHRLDVKEPKKRNHLILRLKQIQKEEERQAEIDHENKLLLNKMTHVLKNGGNIDNWNNYESRSLNFPFRERHNEDIARENIGIAQRLETVKPKVEISKWRSVDTLNETYDEDNNSVDTSDDKKLPKLKKARKAAMRPTKSETSYPTSKPERSPVRGGGTKLPKINNRAEKSAKIEKVPSIRKEKSAKAVKSAQKENIPYMKKDNGVTAAHKDIGDDKSDDLITELKNGLGQPWEYLIDALLQEKGVADSYAVFDALSTTDMADVVELLCSRDNASINALKESYRKEFSISLEEDISDRSEPPTRTLLLTLQKGARDQSASVDMDEVRKDAQELHEYGDERFESENGIFMKLLLTRNYKHLGAMFREYRNVAGEEILAAMKFDCDKNYYRLLSTLVHCVAAPDVFHADKLQKHSIPSDPVLVNILVARSELDMPEIRKAYKTKFGIDIVEVLKSKPHPTQKCLVELACKGSAPKKTDGKKTYLKETAASKQQEQQQQQAKKTGPKKSEPKGKGQGQQQDHSTDNNAPAKSEPMSKSVEAKSQKTKHADHETAPQQKKKDTANEQQAKTQDTQGGDKGKSKGTKDTSDGVRQNNGTVRPYANFNVDADCDKLNSAMTDLQGDEREKVVISIIPRRSNKQRQELKTAYEQKHKKELRAIKEHYQKDDYKGKAKAVEDPVQYYSERIHGCFTSMGVNDNMIVRLVVSRSEIDLEDIKARYMELYSQSLYDAVNSKCQGEYKNLLLAIIDKNVNQSENVESNTTAHRDNKDTDQSVNPPTSSDTDYSKEESNTKGTDLERELTSELRGDFEALTVALLTPPVEYDVKCLNGAIKGIGTDEAVLVSIIATRNIQEMEAIKLKYEEMYGRRLEADVCEDVSGGLERMLVQLLACERDQRDTVDMEEVKQDVQRLYKEGQISIDPNDDVFNEIIVKKDRAHVKATFEEYKKVTGADIYHAIKEALTGDAETAYLKLAKAIEDPIQYYTDALHACFKGLGTNDGEVIRIVVSRSEIDLGDISTRYQRTYGSSLAQSVEDECSGDYKRLLLAIVGRWCGQ